MRRIKMTLTAVTLIWSLFVPCVRLEDIATPETNLEKTAHGAACSKCLMAVSVKKLKNGMRLILKNQSVQNAVIFAKKNPGFQIVAFGDLQNSSVPEQKLTLQELSEEIVHGEMELLSLLVFAEAGNQGLDGMRLVADVVLNRWDDPRFGDTIAEIIFADGQFGPTIDGSLDRAGWNITENAYKAVEMEWFAEKEDRLNSGILYFNTTWDNGVNPFKYGDHWFSY